MRNVKAGSQRFKLPFLLQKLGVTYLYCMCQSNVPLHFSFVVFFDREKCQGGQPRSSGKEVPYDESWYCPCCCAAVLELVMIQS